MASVCKMTEWIEVLFAVETFGYPTNIVLHGVPLPLQWGERFNAAIGNFEGDKGKT